MGDGTSGATKRQWSDQFSYKPTTASRSSPRAGRIDTSSEGEAKGKGKGKGKSEGEVEGEGEGKGEGVANRTGSVIDAESEWTHLTRTDTDSMG